MDQYDTWKPKFAVLQQAFIVVILNLDSRSNLQLVQLILRFALFSFNCTPKASSFHRSLLGNAVQNNTLMQNTRTAIQSHSTMEKVGR